VPEGTPEISIAFEAMSIITCHIDICQAKTVACKRRPCCPQAARRIPSASPYKSRRALYAEIQKAVEMKIQVDATSADHVNIDVCSSMRTCVLMLSSTRRAGMQASSLGSTLCKPPP